MFSFREIQPSDAQLILDWRTSKRVTEQMNTDVAYDVQAQVKWLQDCYAKPDYYHWIIQQDGHDIGLINFSDWQADKQSISWGFYIGAQTAVGAGGKIPPYMHKFCFDRLAVDMIQAKVFYTNIRTIQLHLLHGYLFTPEHDRVIRKHNKDILLVAMSLQRDAYLKSRFTKSVADFPLDGWQHKASIDTGKS